MQKTSVHFTDMDCISVSLSDLLLSLRLYVLFVASKLSF